MLGERRATVLAGGHTHSQMLRRYSDMILLNPGSVGLPFEQNVATGRSLAARPGPRVCASFMWADHKLSIELRRVPVDSAAIVQAARQRHAVCRVVGRRIGRSNSNRGRSADLEGGSQAATLQNVQLADLAWILQPLAHDPHKHVHCRKTGRSANNEGDIMLTKNMQDAINQQIKHEFYYRSSTAMSAYFGEQQPAGLPQAGCVFRARKSTGTPWLFNFITDRDGSVELQALDQPPSEFAAPLDVFQQALEHERRISGLDPPALCAAVKERDYPAQIHLQWFIDEQVEEEKNATQIVEQLKLAGNDGVALLMSTTPLARARGSGAVSG